MYQFTYDYYSGLLKLLDDMGYSPTTYGATDIPDKSYILRHDVDYSLFKALRIGEIDKEYGIHSIFFVLLSTSFYNVFSKDGKKILETLRSNGHEIGLHFDERKYPDDFGKADKICDHIIEEASVLSHAVGCPVTKVSMHRPSKEIIDSDLKIPGIINTYGSEYIKGFKYVADSRREWREPFEDYVRNCEYNRFQILIHPFWYNETDLSIEESIRSFVADASVERYYELDDNIRNLKDILVREDI